MKCGKCGNTAPDGSMFCNACGSSFSDDRDKPQRILKPGESFCWKCGGVVPPYMSFCPSCGSSLDSPEAFKALTGTPNVPRNCEKCGKPVASGGALCSSCLYAEPERPAGTLPEPKSNRPIVVGILLLGAFFLSMISLYMLATSSDDLANEYPLDISGLLLCCETIVIVAGFSCVLGSMMSFKRSNYSLVVFAAAIGILCMGPFYLGSLLSFIALIIAALSKRDYNE